MSRVTIEQIGEKRMIQRLELEDKMVRDALIALGWTPPNKSTQ